ncbi:ubiquitin-conjugating enzyme E2-17 kDa [Trifolium repens]|nr:ubiquitin-conjugating enzyme E2-17 kDa [Trifolium repens]
MRFREELLCNADEVLLVNNFKRYGYCLYQVLRLGTCSTGKPQSWDRLIARTQVAGCEVASGKIGEIISLDGEKDQKVNSFSGIPDEFFEDMESVWKGLIKTTHVDDVLTSLDKAAEALHLAKNELNRLNIVLIQVTNMIFLQNNDIAYISRI